MLTFARPSFLSSTSSASSSATYQLLPSSSPSSSTLDDLAASHSRNTSRRRTKKVVVVLACAVGVSLAFLSGWDGGLGELGTTTAVGGKTDPSPSSEEGYNSTLGWSETGEWQGDGDSSPPIDPADDQDEVSDPAVLLAELDHAHHPRIHLPSPARLPSSHLLPYPAPSPACLLHLFTLSSTADFDSTLCPRSSSPEPLDSVTTFVNGTGPLFLDAYEKAISEQEGVTSAARHYSNMGEMRFSLRSVARGLVGKRASKGMIRGVGSDFAVPGRGGNELERIAQIPNWLNASLLARPWDPPSLSSPIPADSKAISWSFHSEIFLGSPSWLASALPTFNSFAIESQLHNIPSLSSSFVSLNDDFFVLRPMSASDFHTELLGPVFRVQDDLKVVGKENARVGDPGEWAALDWAAWTLGKRHPSAGLEYLTHLPKTLTVAHLHEISVVFNETLLASSQRKFREQKTSGPDIEIAFLATHYIRQRHREALLFSYVVARSGGTWGRPERDELVALGVDGWIGHVGDGLIDLSAMETAGMVDLMDRAGEEPMLATTAEFSSFSGLPKIAVRPPRPKPLDLSECLGPWWSSEDANEKVDAEWIFKRITFEQHRCGDLLITAILRLSPLPGLTALLPLADTFFVPPSQTTPLKEDAESSSAEIYTTPHLPLTPTWEEANFSLPSLFPPSALLPTQGLDLQDWCLRLLGRYRYVMATTPSHFTSIRHINSIAQLRRVLSSKQHENTTLLALNDDVPAYTSQADREVMGNQVRIWGEERWPGGERWEIDEVK